MDLHKNNTNTLSADEIRAIAQQYKVENAPELPTANNLTQNLQNRQEPDGIQLK